MGPLGADANLVASKCALLTLGCVDAILINRSPLHSSIIFNSLPSDDGIHSTAGRFSRFFINLTDKPQRRPSQAPLKLPSQSGPQAPSPRLPVSRPPRSQIPQIPQIPQRPPLICRRVPPAQGASVMARPVSAAGGRFGEATHAFDVSRLRYLAEWRLS